MPGGKEEIEGTEMWRDNRSGIRIRGRLEKEGGGCGKRGETSAMRGGKGEGSIERRRRGERWGGYCRDFGEIYITTEKLERG